MTSREITGDPQNHTKAGDRQDNDQSQTLNDLLNGFRSQIPCCDEPPNYASIEADINETVQQLSTAAQACGLDIPIRTYTRLRFHNWSPEKSLTIGLRDNIINAFFQAIENKNDEMVALLIDQNLVSTETIDRRGRTPLLAAVEAGDIRMVQQLMDYDADVNAYGNAYDDPYGAAVDCDVRKPFVKEVRRTPLQLAAQKGNLVLVKLLVETYGADDSLIAPDGQLALRLAATNGHAEIVRYLPSRRGGGWRRYKIKHAKAMDRTRRVLRHSGECLRFVYFSVPKFIVWTTPKHLIIKPIGRSLKWARKHYREVPGIIRTWLKEVWELIKQVPKALVDFVKELPELTQNLAKAVMELTLDVLKLIWKLLTRALPKIFFWLLNQLKSISRAVGSVLKHLFSLFHSSVWAILNFCHDVTLNDLWTQFCWLLRSVFVDIPRAIVRVFHDFAGKMYGRIGELASVLWLGTYEIFILTIPKIISIFGTLAKNSFNEVAIWFNPKRI